MEPSDRLRHLLHMASTTNHPNAQTIAADYILSQWNNPTPTKTHDDDDDNDTTESLHRQALELYISAARAGSTDAARKAGCILWRDGEKRAAEKLMMEAVERGDGEACRMLADWLWVDAERKVESKGRKGGGGGEGQVGRDGDGSESEEEDTLSIDSDDSDHNDMEESAPPNTKPTARKIKDPRRKAFKLYLHSATKWHDIPSIRRVAECYASGEVVGKQNLQKAAAYWEMAARQGDRSAVGTLARYYQGVVSDDTDGKVRTNQKSGNATVLESNTAAGTSSKDPEDSENTPSSKLLRYIKQAASDGDAPSLRCLADAYLNGLGGIQRQPDAALDLYLKAASAGDISSLAQAATLLHTGDTGIPRDRRRAFALYESSAKQGWTPSFRSLAECYRTGEGAPDDRPNLVKARKCFEEAAWQGDVGSWKSLGDCYWSGIGCERDRGKAAEYYEKGAGAGDVDAVRCLARCYWLGVGVELDKHRAKRLIVKTIMNGDEGFGMEVAGFEVERVDDSEDDRFEEMMNEGM
ncbi:hypothetical protein HK097_008317 [Rhizophlyctis rosea]|uniref:Uncharacterized protein n=1 Tax=Rhizophlyctis rosea TaxID=64517 RepID=A0AAD5X5C7_9FUNG|nr:hypothetical protein HK097_008317 [Rhizophlyctis rosea]